MENSNLTGSNEFSLTEDLESLTSPSSMGVKQCGLKIVIDDFPDEDIGLRLPDLGHENVQYIRNMIQKIKELTKKKVDENFEEYIRCHRCQSMLEPNLLICCTEPECDKNFCFRCLNKRFGKKPEDIIELNVSPEWKCLACQSLCNCRTCKKIVLDNIKKSSAAISSGNIPRKGRPRKVLSMHKAGDQSMVSGFTDNFSINISIKHRTKSLARRFHLQMRLNQSSGMENEKNTKFMDFGNKEVGVREKILNAGNITEKCHMCHEYVKMLEVATCSIENCKKHYCVGCIRKFYQEAFQLFQSYKPDCCLCYSCGGICECMKCKRRREAGKRSQDILKVKDQLLTFRLAKKISSLHGKRRIKYYDTLSEEEEEQEQKQLNTVHEVLETSAQSEALKSNPDHGHGEELEQNEFQTEDQEQVNKFLLIKKRRLSKTLATGKEGSTMSYEISHGEV